jgi:hypothetical protein
VGRFASENCEGKERVRKQVLLLKNDFFPAVTEVNFHPRKQIGKFYDSDDIF